MKYDQLKTLVQNSAVDKLQKHIVTDFKAAFPFIKTVETYNGQFGQSGVKRASGSAHAIYVTALGAPSSKPQAAGNRDHTITVSAYVLAVDVAGIARDQAAFAIAEKIAELAHFKRWTDWQGKLGFAEDVKITRISSEALEKAGACLVGVTWTQSVLIGKDQFDNPEGTPATLASVEIGEQTIHGEAIPEGSQHD